MPPVLPCLHFFDGETVQCASAAPSERAHISVAFLCRREEERESSPLRAAFARMSAPPLLRSSGFSKRQANENDELGHRRSVQLSTGARHWTPRRSGLSSTASARQPSAVDSRCSHIARRLSASFRARIRLSWMQGWVAWTVGWCPSDYLCRIAGKHCEEVPEGASQLQLEGQGGAAELEEDPNRADAATGGSVCLVCAQWALQQCFMGRREIVCATVQQPASSSSSCSTL